MLLAGQVMANDAKRIYGYVEKVTLLDKKMVVNAKLDTGAKSASLNATEITPVDIHGKSYLRFTVPNPKGDQVFTCEYVGQVSIKVRSGESKIAAPFKKSINRPVVRMSVGLGDETRMIRVNLTNRKRFIYPLLLGRDALIAFHAVVDPAMSFTLKKKDDVAQS